MWHGGRRFCGTRRSVTRKSLRLYCLQNARIVYGNLGGNNVVSVGSDLGYQLEIDKPLATFGQLNGFINSAPKINFGVYGTTDVWVYRYISVLDQDWQTLFTGYIDTQLVSGKGYYTLPDARMDLDMSDFVPVRLPEDGWVYILTTVNGYEEWVSVYTDDSIMWFPRGLAQKPGTTLVFQPYNSGHPSIVVNVHTGELVPISTVSGSLLARFPGVEECTNSINLVVESDDGVGVSPLIELTITKDGLSIPINIKSSEGEFPLGLWMYPDDDSTNTEPVYMDFGGQHSVTLIGEKAGVHHYRIHWPKLQSPYRPYQWYWYGKG